MLEGCCSRVINETWNREKTGVRIKMTETKKKSANNQQDENMVEGFFRKRGKELSKN